MGADGPRRLDAGNGTDGLKEAVRKSELAGCSVVAGVGIDFERGEVVRVEVEIDVENTVEAFAEKSGGREKEDGKGELDDDQVGTEASPGAGGTVSSAGKAGAQICHGQARHGSGRADDQRDNRYSGNKKKHAMIEPDRPKVGHAAKDALGDERCEQIDGGPCSGHSTSYRDSNEKSCFHKQLAGKARTGSTQRAADSHLAAAAFRPDEEKTGNVEAGDEEQKNRAGEQNEKQRAKIAGDEFGEGHYQSALSLVGLRVLLLKVARDGAGVGEGCGNGDAILQAGEGRKRAAGAVVFAGAEVMNRNPELGRTGSELEAAGKDTDDRIGVVVEGDGLAEDVGPSAEVVLPGRVGQHDGARRFGRVIGRGEQAAEDWVGAERLEESARDAAYAQRLNAGGIAPQVGIVTPD